MQGDEGYVHPQYCNEDGRRATFTTWPLQIKQRGRQLARCGFFYTLIGAKVRAFCCGLELRDLEVDDDPINLHRRFSPDCPFIRTQYNVFTSDVYCDTRVPTPSTNLQHCNTFAPTVPLSAMQTGSNPGVVKCRDDETSHDLVTFLPCRHATVCYRCAWSYRDCPVCGERIKGTKPFKLIYLMTV